ncbi:GGDEF domain-containing protein [Shewanella schlegeliana]|uniref:diguanylate cyclase n=1 Tax=Shewanella schlegeliana TaxID=190308 RepID=A0ABS1STK7_9GAMM|nr:GGDEF domain-containing protein [Shewanella schlegeliana]MBL4911872.1 GGDEF domain-containing protein [Shewanella schlegeliana]MCL1110175.1 GGDEF domain-containing protein [Shewanella schlegeliana]GIU27074.1 diguanylate cyclase [Shewanella schlegeliana]
MANPLLKESALKLKKAIPLMLKHQIPTTPTNYALWYAYVGEKNPKLNQHLDEIVGQYNTCPPSHSERLYREYLADPAALNVVDMRLNLDAMVTELSQSLKDTNLDASQFHHKINNNYDKLNKIDNEGFTIEEVLTVVKGLVRDSNEIRVSAQHFSAQLAKAQSEIDVLKQQLKQSEHEMHYDALTGSLNRRAFDNDLKGILAQHPDGLCLIIADIDHFKAFNDTYGHQLGDQVLKAVTKRLTEACKDGTKLYRFGGEEFALIVPKSQLRRARQLAESMRRSLEKLTLKDRRKGETINNISASFGVAQYQVNDNHGSLIDRADSQLYQAKNLGRNRVMPIVG